MLHAPSTCAPSPCIGSSQRSWICPGRSGRLWTDHQPQNNMLQHAACACVSPACARRRASEAQHTKHHCTPKEVIIHHIAPRAHWGLRPRVGMSLGGVQGRCSRLSYSAVPPAASAGWEDLGKTRLFRPETTCGGGEGRGGEGRDERTRVQRVSWGVDGGSEGLQWRLCVGRVGVRSGRDRNVGAGVRRNRLWANRAEVVGDGSMGDVGATLACGDGIPEGGGEATWGGNGVGVWRRSPLRTQYRRGGHRGDMGWE